jgi:two-component system sensor histidine kinase HydH
MPPPPPPEAFGGHELPPPGDVPDGPPLGRPPGGPRPGIAPPDRPPPLRLVLEFEPLAARQLLLVARRTLLAGVVAVPAFVGCAVLLAFLTRQRNLLVRRLEHERRLAALGEMSAVLAHEIRNPLASLKGHAQLLARSLDGDAARGAKAELIVREAVRLQDLATDLLDFAGSAGADRTDTDPAALLRESADTVDAARIVVDVATSPPTWPLDAARMRQALVNVLRNAVQASPDGASVEAAAFLEREQLIFEVRDHGTGIPPGDVERIFEPFHTRKLRGTGLGLAIARRVVEQQGGSIVARNLPGGGACFRIAIART